MFFKFFFSRMSLQKQVSRVKKKGVLLGTRRKDGRKIYIYMINDLFVEVFYKGDDLEHEGEAVNVLHGLETLNDYLEKEFKASF